MTSATKIFMSILFFVFGTKILIAQNSVEEQFNYAKKLYEEENYFDAVTEFKRLLYFDLTGTYSYQANFLIGLSYKNGNKFSDALQYFTLSDLSSTTSDEAFESRLEIIKINILRRTTERAFVLLDSLQNTAKFSNRIDEINYWRGWAYIFSDDWDKASATFSKIQNEHQLVVFCDSIKSDFYNPQLAKYLSILPGAGQFYTGEYVSGFISIGWNVLWGYLTINAFIEDRVLDGVLIGSLLWWRFYSGNIQNAEKFALEKNLEITNSALRYLQNHFNGKKP
jgi:tetratricopeptide (TPR) repeat protein